MICEKIIDEKQRIETQIKLLQRQLDELPEGKLNYASTGKYSKWYRSDGHNQTYIPKKERPLAEKLALKNYLSLQLGNLLQEKKAIESYLKYHDIDAYQKEQSFMLTPEYKELLAPNYTPLFQELQKWMNAPYERNNKHPENLKNRACSGNLVRSKSESMIDMILYNNKIPFRYECILQLGETFVFPDFTIRHPITGEFYYWEHFGLADDPNYSRHIGSKLQLYISNGIIPSIQLITTYETKENPLCVDDIRKIVKHYFL